MRCFASLLTLSLLPALVGCPAKRVTPPMLPPVEPDIAALVIPLSEQSRPEVEGALERLRQAAEAGDERAAWARVHYLIDLFDDARFRRDDHSLALLHRALGHPDNAPVRGTEATDQVLDSLLREVDDLFALDRMHAHVQSARTVLEFESRPPRSRVGLFMRMAELEAIAKVATEPLADNARLRMIGYCRRALSDIAHTKYATRFEVLAHCLYPLYRSDPEPYFARMAEDRPPTPRWQDIVAELTALCDQVAASRGRMALAGAHLRGEIATLAAEHAGDMPAVPDLAALTVPRSTRVGVYDWTPLYILDEDAHGMGALSDLSAVTQAVAGDGRKTATVALPRSASAIRVLAAGDALAKAGAERLELAVVTSQFLKVPRGDYWYGKVAGDTADRLGVYALSLASLDGVPQARTQSWDPSRARLGLYLEVTGQTWTLTSATGVVATIPSSAKEHAQQTLRGMLAWLYAAFPEEDALYIVPGTGATVTDLVHALEACRYDAQGRELMAVIGLARRLPKVTENTLADRIERRSKAAVEVQPAALAVRTSVVRACYQDALDKRPKARGSFRLELHGGAVSVVQGPKDEVLRACVVTGLEAMMKSQNMASAQVELLVE